MKDTIFFIIVTYVILDAIASIIFAGMGNAAISLTLAVVTLLLSILMVFIDIKYY